MPITVKEVEMVDLAIKCEYEKYKCKCKLQGIVKEGRKCTANKKLGCIKQNTGRTVTADNTVRKFPVDGYCPFHDIDDNGEIIIVETKKGIVLRGYCYASALAMHANEEMGQDQSGVVLNVCEMLSNKKISQICSAQKGNDRNNVPCLQTGTRRMKMVVKH